MASSESQEIKLTGLFAQLLGVWYPMNYVVAAIDAAEGPKAVNDLLSAGFGSNSVYLRDSDRVSEIRAAIYEQRTPLERAGAALSRALTDEGIMSKEYFDEAKEGASLIAVLCPERRLIDEAHQVLRAHGARRIRYYGAHTITDLS